MTYKIKYQIFQQGAYTSIHSKTFFIQICKKINYEYHNREKINVTVCHKGNTIFLKQISQKLSGTSMFHKIYVIKFPELLILKILYAFSNKKCEFWNLERF